MLLSPQQGTVLQRSNQEWEAVHICPCAHTYGSPASSTDSLAATMQLATEPTLRDLLLVRIGRGVY